MSLTRWLESARGDVHFALRALRKSPVFTLTAIGTIALGISANTAIFSMLNAAFLRPLPYNDPARVVWATEFFPKFKSAFVLAPEYIAWKRQSTAFNRLEAFGVTIGVNLAGANQAAERVLAGHVTPGFFEVLGVQPQIGRTFSSDESQPGRDNVVLIADRLWRDYFHADAQILGKPVTVDGSSRTIIGVVPPGFVSPDSSATRVWLPDAVKPDATIPKRSMGLLSVIGRLNPGVTLEQARGDLDIIARRMDSQYPIPWWRYHAEAKVRVLSLQNQIASGSRTALYILMGAAGFILLIVCANVADLFLVRSITRGREIAIRLTIGASRSRLIRLLLIESLLVGLAGGMAGGFLAYRSASMLRFLLPDLLSPNAAIDGRVLVFAAICSLFASLLFGVTPALASSRVNLNASLKEGGSISGIHRGPTLRGALVVFQVALSLMLLVGAGLLLRSFVFVLNVNRGFDAHNVLLADVSLAPLEMYPSSRQITFFDGVLDQVRGIPGVQYAAVASATPLVPLNVLASGLRAEGERESDAAVCMTSASADYFKALRIPLLAGRPFSERDRDGMPQVAIINQSLARILFGNREPIGRRVNIREGKDPWVTIVGVVADIRHRSLDSKVWPELWQPYQQAPNHWMSVVVRSYTDPATLAPALREAVQSFDRSQPVFNVQSLEERVDDSVAERRHRAYLLGVFATIALVIAIIGIYGVIAYSVSRRTHEMGVRLALGAGGPDLLKLVLGEGLRLALVGVALGLAGAIALTRTLSTFLYGVTPTDQLTFISVCGILIASACLASLIPARRAAKVDPMVTLRHE